VPSYNNLDVYHIILNGDSIRATQMNNKPVEITPDLKGPVKARYKLFPELDFGKAGYTAVLAPSLQVVNGTLAYLVTVTSPDGTKVKYFYDMKSGLKIKQYTDVPNSTVMEWSDYQAIQNGVKIPFTENTVVVNQPITFKVKSATVNTGLTADTFK